MKADYTDYRKGVQISLIGLVLQASIAAAFAIYSRYAGGDHATMSAAITLAVGMLIWFALVVLFDQQRRERIEAMESESLSAMESAAASAFESTGDDMQPAARRLELIKKWFLPAVAIIVAITLASVGYARLAADGGAFDLFDPDQYAKPRYPAVGIGIALFAAFVGFVFARFVSGMSKEDYWAPLRAGAAQIVGGALLGLLFFVGFFVDLAGGPDWPFRTLQVIVPIAMLIGGAEILLNFVLDLYRPRSPGQAYRPSFDSRLLGFAAAPDKIAESIGEAINYQFGVDVTSSWFYQLLSRSIAWLLLVAGLIGWGLTSLVIVQPHQRAMVLTFGEVSRTDLQPGLHVVWPWPISTIVTPEHVIEVGDNETELVATTTGIQVLHLASNPPDAGTEPIVWGEQHAAVEILHVVQPTSEDGIESDVTGGLSLIAVEVPVHYVIDNVELYDRLAAPGQQQQLLESVGRSVITRVLSTKSVEEVLASERVELAQDFRNALEAQYASMNSGQGAGIKLVFVGAAGVHPPRESAGAFEAVVQAQQTREQLIERARQAQIRILTEAAGNVTLAEDIVARLNGLDQLRTQEAPESEVAQAELEVQRLLEQAGGQAGEALLAAGARRWEAHMSERSRAALFAGQTVSYQAAPALYRANMYFDSLLSAMNGSRVYIASGKTPLETIIELQDRRSGADVFQIDGQEDGL